MAEDFLTKIVQEKKVFIKEQKGKISLETLQKKSQKPYPRHSFKDAIVKLENISLIAEIKQASPSQGIIRKNFNPGEIALIYQRSGASALSVLTEERYFKGSLSHISLIRERSELPILRKDFIVDSYQIYESYISGADAILLIVDILSDLQLSEFLDLAGSLSLDCLTEVDNEKDLKRALSQNAEIIGINNRNLRTFDVDLDISYKLVPLIPKERIIVVESGIKESKDINSLKSLGINAVLIGEALLTAKDISAKIKQLMG